MKSFLNAFLDAVYPFGCVCFLCGSEALVDELGVCLKCRPMLNQSPHPLNIDSIDGFRSGLSYEGLVAQKIREFKYGGKRFLAHYFAEFMNIPGHWNVEVIIPVPLHRKRLKERGYNQSALLSKFISEKYGILVDADMLQKTLNTQPQAVSSLDERLLNLNGAFRASNQCRSKGVLIVDDVATTGSTLKECALTLKAAGARYVYALTACTAELD